MSRSVDELYTNISFLMNVLGSSSLWKSAPKEQRCAEAGWTPWMGIATGEDQALEAEKSATKLTQAPTDEERKPKGYNNALKKGLIPVKKVQRPVVTAKLANEAESGSKGLAGKIEVVFHPAPKIAKPSRSGFTKPAQKKKNLPVPPAPSVAAVGNASKFSLLKVEEPAALIEDTEEAYEVAITETKKAAKNRRKSKKAEHATVPVVVVHNNFNLFKFVSLGFIIMLICIFVTILSVCL